MYMVTARVIRTACGGFIGYTRETSYRGGLTARSGPVVSTFGQAMRHAKLRKAQLLQRHAWLTA